MSKRNNVNPDHYKVAGRERPGRDIVPEAERQALRRAGERARSRTPRIPNQERAGRRAPARRKSESS
jgi:hypothetical protein